MAIESESASLFVFIFFAQVLDCIRQWAERIANKKQIIENWNSGNSAIVESLLSNQMKNYINETDKYPFM